jgi:hypothetical protein
MIKGETGKVGDLPANQSTDVSLGIDLTKDTLVAIKDVLFKKEKWITLLKVTLKYFIQLSAKPDIAFEL